MKGLKRGESVIMCTLPFIVIPPVGASLLAKNSLAPRVARMSTSSLTFFASKLAPTVFHPGRRLRPLWPSRCHASCPRNSAI
ncbi:hypothetical protein EUX58_06965 [Pseudomonas sp. 770NI]|nr:hypothetical protein EUX58_06965 [Pseudomonas sp. 770NI]